MSLYNFLFSVFLPSTVSIATAIAVIKVLAKKLIEHRLAKDMENHKGELKERAEAIKSVYSAMVKWSSPVTNILVGNPHVDTTDYMDLKYYEARAEEAHSAGLELSEVLVENAIYFEPELYEKIAKAVTTSIKAVAYFLRPIRAAESADVDWPIVHKEVEKNREKLKNLHEHSILPLHREVTDEFRKLIGAMRS